MSEADVPEPLARYLAGELSAPLALTQWLMRAGSIEAAAPQLADPRLAELASLLRENRAGADRALALLAGLDHRQRPGSTEEGIAYFRAAFDGAVAADAASSVALYTLGNEDILRAATKEVVDLLHRWGLVERNRRVLDLGCGIGRIAMALAGEVASVAGIDVSAGMVAEARRRCASHLNVSIVQGSGRDLSGFADRCMDMVLAVDSFPYLFLSGGVLAEAYVAEAARVLVPGGDLLILNLSYRSDPAADRQDMAQFAAANGFTVLRNGTRDLALWDGAAFHLRRR